MVEILRQRSRFWHFNALAILSEGEAAVVDPGIFPDELDNFRGSILSKDCRASTVILTHSHHDHIRGWQAFPGAKIVAPQRLKDKDANARARIVAAKEAIDRKFKVSDPGFLFPEPAITFQETLLLHVGETTVELRMLPGHSDCSSAVLVPEAKALFSGDYLVSPGMPYCRWRIDRHVEALGKLRRWVGEFGVETIFPAHNDPISGRENIEAGISKEEAYFERLVEVVRELSLSGKPEDEIAKEAASRIRPGKIWEQDRDNAKRALRELSEK